MQVMLKTPLYHGTVTKFNKVNLSHGHDYKDFGKGFYLAYSYKQSEGIVRKLCKIKHATSGVIYSYTVNQEAFMQLYREKRVLIFNDANSDWLLFVNKSRHTRGTWHSYDVVIGPTADDEAKLLIDNFNDGFYGSVTDFNVQNRVISLLHSERLGTQVFIATDRGLSIIDELNRGEKYYAIR